MNGLESHRVVSIGSEICEQDRGADDDHPRAAATNLSTLGRTSSMDSGEGPYVSLFELRTTTRPEHDERASPSDAAGGEPALTVSGLVAALRAQRRELEAARAELHGERRARAELEEQGELDREAARVAMQLVHEAETEKHELQRQLDALRVRAQLHDYEAAGLDAADYSAPTRRAGAGTRTTSRWWTSCRARSTPRRRTWPTC
uniref:GTD-binding domain-containing protein n=1 Tax=Aegilops tauschii subsp. strangulata TaxID=200361 RepID=A0A453DX20_AEGTS